MAETMPSELRASSRIYISAVVAAGLFVVLESLHSISQEPIHPNWLMLAVLTLLSGSFTVRIPGIPARLSVSETFVFAAALLFGPPAATMTVVLDTLVISFWLGRTTASPPWSRLSFNIAAAAIAIWAATHVFYYFTAARPLAIEPGPIVPLLPWLLLLASLYFLLNSWLVAFVVGFQKQRSALSVWRQSFLWLSLNYYSGASIAALILPYLMQAQASNSAFMYVVGIILPVLLISYLTFKTALGRIDDANKHLSELNRLYLSTIETLAMAIDAKDQITHGHIRRVQQYAVSLAKHLGITDVAQISAIEAASLLHDMGKLAVPEYILNKPGALTPAEFDRMKLHASIGADILSAIDFPYPVVPIVRHHHENWDGTGYPSQLRGTAIPIGARILSVVDCFDALTSDRPYRPRMSDAEALKILLARRGSMYDPLIVDAFITIHASVLKGTLVTHTDAKLNTAALEHVFTDGIQARPDSASGRRASFEEITASTEETLVLYDLATGLTGHLELSDVGDVISKHLRRIIPASVVVFFVYDPHTDDLVSAHAAGNHASHLVGLRIPRGERLSGWVAANRQTIVNADPVLDLGEVARLLRPRLRSCISTPLVCAQELIGVLSLYSVEQNVFNDDHKRVLEVVGRQVSQTVHHALSFEHHRAIDLRDRATGLPNVRHFERMMAAASSNVQPDDKVSVVSVRVRPTGFLTAAGDATITDEAIEAVATAVRKALRGGDLLFRYAHNELVVLLTQTDAETADLVADRIRATIKTEFVAHSATEFAVDVILGVATAPASGVSVQSLVDASRTHEYRAEPPPTSVH
jgi:diguanylate cyclase (GGDEF)-like protein/putative nucleotidyltransferase with HDIG domain